MIPFAVSDLRFFLCFRTLPKVESAWSGKTQLWILSLCDSLHSVNSSPGKYLHCLGLTLLAVDWKFLLWFSWMFHGIILPNDLYCFWQYQWSIMTFQGTFWWKFHFFHCDFEAHWYSNSTLGLFIVCLEVFFKFPFADWCEPYSWNRSGSWKTDGTVQLQRNHW